MITIKGVITIYFMLFFSLGIIVKSDPQSDKAGGSSAPKKTKILVPLKDLMETLQQKSFLVSPLGPNKKIIRFTGSDSVKGT